MRHSIALGVAALALGCSDALAPAKQASLPLAPTPFAVSNPRPAASSAVAVATNAATANVVYVALSPGTIPNAQTVTIRVLPTGTTVAATAVDGGLDPVAVPAGPRDTLDITVTRSSGESALHYVAPVPGTKPPTVIRTSPPPKKRDVPLNTNVVVVFSEPISLSTLSGSVRLTSGTTVIAGQLGSDDAAHLTATFVPDRPLAPGTDYQLDVTQGIQDLDGQSLDAAVAVQFTTTTTVTTSGPATGQIAFVSSRDGTSQIYVMNADGSGVSRLTSDAGKHGHPAWSPDGKKIAFTNDVAGVNDIYTMNADGSGVVRLTRDLVESSDPAWSPDGTRIAFTRGIGGFSGRIAVMYADGSSVALVSAPAAYPYDIMDSAPAWSPDGSKIAFNRSYYDDLTPSTIYVMQSDGGAARVLNVQSGSQPGSFMSYAEAAPAWSPDGTRILFWSYWASPFAATPMIPRSASPGYALRKSDGSGDLMLLPISVPVIYSNKPDWSPDGNHIVFASGVAPTSDIYIATADGSGVARLTIGGDQPAWRPRP